MNFGINIVYCNPNGSLPQVQQELELASESEVHEQSEALEWTKKRGGNYVIEFCIGDEVIDEFVTDGAGVIAICEQVTLRGVAA